MLSLPVQPRCRTSFLEFLLTAPYKVNKVTVDSKPKLYMKAVSRPLRFTRIAIMRVVAEAAGLEPAHAMRGDLANRCHTIRRRLQLMNGGRDRSRTCKRQMRGSFQDYCLTS